MELWVRSQDKKILQKVNKLYATTYSEEAGYGIYDLRYDNLEDIDDCDVPLGFYKSKERALEILDEISSKIKNQYIVEIKGLIKPCDLKKKKENFEKMYNGDFIMQTPSFEIKPINPHVIYFEMPED